MKGWRIFLVLVGLLVVFGSGMQGGIAQGNSDAAHVCQDGGYRDWRDADGNGFENAGQCVRYVAQGGTLMPARSATLSFTPRPNFSCIAVLTVGGYAPGTYSVTLTGFTENAAFVKELVVGTNGAGTVTSNDGAAPFAYDSRSGIVVTAYVDGQPVDTETVSC